MRIACARWCARNRFPIRNWRSGGVAKAYVGKGVQRAMAAAGGSGLVASPTRTLRYGCLGGSASSPSTVQTCHNAFWVRARRTAQQPRSAAAVCSAAAWAVERTKSRSIVGLPPVPLPHPWVPALAFALAFAAMAMSSRRRTAWAATPHGVLVQVGHREPRPRPRASATPCSKELVAAWCHGGNVRPCTRAWMRRNCAQMLHSPSSSPEASRKRQMRAFHGNTNIAHAVMTSTSAAFTLY